MRCLSGSNYVVERRFSTWDDVQRLDKSIRMAKMILLSWKLFHLSTCRIFPMIDSSIRHTSAIKCHRLDQISSQKCKKSSQQRRQDKGTRRRVEAISILDKVWTGTEYLVSNA
jgi:hypothetical protein